MNPRTLFTFVLPFIFALAGTSASPLATRNNQCTPNFGNNPVSIINDLFEWGFPSAAQPAFGDTMVLKVTTPNRPEFRFASAGADTFTISAVNAASAPAVVLTTFLNTHLSLIPVTAPPSDRQKFTISCTDCSSTTAFGCTFRTVSSPGLCVRQSGSLYSVPLFMPCIPDLDQRWTITTQ